MGFNSMNPKDAMRSNAKLEEIFGDRLFDWNWAVKKQHIRFHGPVIAYENFWFDIITEKGKQTRVPKLCIDLDPYTDTYISDDCPFRRSGLGSQSRFYLVNGIWRKEQDNKPAKLPKMLESEKKLKKIIKKTPDFPDGWEAYQLDMKGGSDSWTPNFVFVLSARNAGLVSEMSKENVYKGKNYDPADVDYGCDVVVKYDPKGTGTGKFAIARDEAAGMTPLSDEEMDFLVCKHDVIPIPSARDAEAEWKSFKKRITSEDDKRDDDRGGSNRGRQSASRLDEDDADDDSDRKPAGRGRGRDDDDDGDDEGGRGSSRGRVSSRTSSRTASRTSSRSAKGGRADPDDDIPF